MHLPDLQLVSDTHFCQGGNVEIDPSAAIAPGVVIRAESGGRIIISAGVCIGAGAIIQAYRGDLRLEAGVNLGAGALVLGQGHIGANTCVGSAATLVNPAISADQVIASGSLIGDTSRRPESPTPSVNPENLAVQSPQVQSPQSESPAANQAAPDPGVPSTADQNGASAPVPDSSPTDQNGASASAPDQSANQSANFSQVYGRRQIDQLLITLFPHRQPLNSPFPPDSS